MPPGPIGACWVATSWPDTAWVADSWGSGVLHRLSIGLTAVLSLMPIRTVRSLLASRSVQA